MISYTLNYICAKFGGFTHLVTIFVIFRPNRPDYERFLPSLSFRDRSSVEDISRNRGQNGTKLPKNHHNETIDK